MIESKYVVRTGVYKRKYPSGAVAWQVRFKTNEGLWKGCCGGKTKAEALAAEVRIREKLLQGKDPFEADQSDLTVSELIQSFYGSARFMGSSPGWQRENRARITQWVEPRLGLLKVSVVKKEDVLSLFTKMKSSGLHHSSIKKTLTMVGLLFDHYADLNPIFVNQFRTLKGFSEMFPKVAPVRAINFLLPEELERLFEAAQKAHNELLRPLIVFLSYSGLRRSEALNLTWADVDLNDKFIYVRKSKNGQARTVPLEMPVKEVLESLKGRGEFIFSYSDGSRPHEDSFLKPLRKAAKLAGIAKRIDLHTFRHSFGSNKIRAGFGLQKVSKLLGHSEITLTSKVYSYLLDGDLKVQDDVFRGPQTNAGWVQQAVLAFMGSLDVNNKEAIGACVMRLTGLLSLLVANYENPEMVCASSLLESQKNLEVVPADVTLETLKAFLEGNRQHFTDGRGGGIRTHDLFVPKYRLFLSAFFFKNFSLKVCYSFINSFLFSHLSV
jgi:integrase